MKCIATKKHTTAEIIEFRTAKREEIVGDMTTTSEGSLSE
jgi:hypothetical protein